MNHRVHWTLAALTLVCLLASASFLVDVGGGQPDPVAFDDTIEMGLTGTEAIDTDSADYAVPKAQVFYSQYRYVTGYQMIGSLVTELERPGHERQFGRPLTVYVTDFSGASVTLTDEGYLRRNATTDEWVLASEAVFVVESRARTPGGPAVVPFSHREDAATFAEEHGGELRDWAAVRTMDFGTVQVTRGSMRDRIDDRTAWADATTTEARSLLDRPVSVVVGENAPTLAAAVEQAPSNTTVRVPEGTYETNQTVSKPITIRGAGDATQLRGGNGTVLDVRAERVAIADLRVPGVGEMIVPESVPTDRNGTYTQLNFAYGDAGLVFDRANGSYVHDVGIDTNASGIIIRNSDDVVVEGLDVRGTETVREGLMGVLGVDSRIVVQQSTFVGGRDGVYTHLGDGSVIRDNRIRSLRYGVHEMYTNDALVENNTVHDASTGVIVMTEPAGNVLVDNHVRTSQRGISVTGASSYVAGNVFLDNDEGLAVLSEQSLYERNTIVDNEVGIVSSSLLPTNEIVRNDVVANDVPARVQLGTLRIWSDAEGGNYWGPVPGVDRDGDGIVDRSYHVTGTVDSRVGRTAGASVLAQSPATMARRTVRDTLPGLQATGAVDARPLAGPVRPDVLATVNRTDGGVAGGDR